MESSRVRRLKLCNEMSMPELLSRFGTHLLHRLRKLCRRSRRKFSRERHQSRTQPEHNPPRRERRWRANRRALSGLIPANNHYGQTTQSISSQTRGDGDDQPELSLLVCVNHCSLIITSGKGSLRLCVGRPRRAYDAETCFIHVPRARAERGGDRHHYFPPGRFRFRPTRQ